MISNIQVLRGLAALAVVFYHTNLRIPGIEHTEFNGVAAFFVISGFILTYITRTGASDFLRDRFVRIVPFYWLLTLFMVLASGIGALNLPYVGPLFWNLLLQNPAIAWDWLQANMSGYLTVERLTILLKSLAFIPMSPSKGPVLGVGWSLNLEVFYYLMFGVVLMIKRVWAPAVTALGLLLLWLYGQSSACDGYCEFYTTRSNGNGDLQFALGIVVFYLWTGMKRLNAEPYLRRGKVIIAIAATLFAMHYLLAHLVPNYWLQNFRTLPAMLLFSALLLHSADLRCTWRPLIVLGNASYSLYLTHTIVLEMLRPFGSVVPRLFDYSENVLATIFCVIVSIIVAVGVHYWIERPLLSRLRTRQKAPAEIPTVVGA